MILLRAALLVFALAAMPAWALEFRSLAEPAILYDAPATKARKLFVIARQTPVEVIVSVGAWTKVRDSKGDLAWVESQRLSSSRTLLVRVERSSVFNQADEKSGKVFDVARDVLLELLDPAPAGWARVKHRDGQSGFIKVSQVWGL